MHQIYTMQSKAHTQPVSHQRPKCPAYFPPGRQPTKIPDHKNGVKNTETQTKPSAAITETPAPAAAAETVARPAEAEGDPAVEAVTVWSVLLLLLLLGEASSKSAAAISVGTATAVSADILTKEGVVGVTRSFRSVSVRPADLVSMVRWRRRLAVMVYRQKRVSKDDELREGGRGASLHLPWRIHRQSPARWSRLGLFRPRAARRSRFLPRRRR